MPAFAGMTTWWARASGGSVSVEERAGLALPAVVDGHDEIREVVDAEQVPVLRIPFDLHAVEDAVVGLARGSFVGCNRPLGRIAPMHPTYVWRAGSVQCGFALLHPTPPPASGPLWARGGASATAA
jgi:hypothetical protein